MFMQTFYKLERTMKREYGKAQKSVGFLNEAMKSNKYQANTKKSKIRFLIKVSMKKLHSIFH